MRGTFDRDSQRRVRQRLEIQQAESSQAPSSGITAELRPNGKIVIASRIPALSSAPATANSSTYTTGRSKFYSSTSSTSDYFSHYSLPTTRNKTFRNKYGSVDTTVFSEPSPNDSNMSSQPLLQTAPGKTSQSQLHLPLLIPFRQAHRSPNPSRAQSLLCQRTNLPLMAELYRHPRRSSRGSPQLR